MHAILRSLRLLWAILLALPGLAGAGEVKPGFMLNGLWEFSSQPGAEPGKISMFTQTPGATATWHPDIHSVAPVRIAFYKVMHPGNDRKIRFEIVHGGKTEVRYLDSAAGTAGWETLGTFDFAGDGREYVRLTKVSPGNTRACAMKFEILDHHSDALWQTIVLDRFDAYQFRKVEEKIVTFADVKQHPVRGDIEWLASRGYVQGLEAEHFAPDQPLDRQTLGQWLAAALETSEPADLTRELSGSEGITGEALAIAINRAVEKSGKNTDWARPPASESLERGAAKAGATGRAAYGRLLTLGLLKPDAALAPAAPVTRAQAAVLMRRFIQGIVKSGPPAASRWKLTFQDEFDGDALNWEVWKSQSGPSSKMLCSRWPENAVVGDGLLRLVTRKEKRAGQDWTAAFVLTRTFAQTYGYWEARFRYAGAPGLNNAFWMYNPKGFEIDVNEGHYPNRINMALHQNPTSGARHEAAEDLSKDFHVYGVEWNAREVIYTFDGKTLERKKNLRAHLSAPAMLSTAVFNWAGLVTDALDGKSMDVDWVRVYEKR